MIEQPTAMQRMLVCYSPRDREAKDELIRHLAPLTNTGVLSLWSVDEVPSGDHLPSAFAAAAQRADVALLMLSNDLLADPAVEIQLEVLQQERAQRELRLVPLLWRDCMWRSVGWLAELKPAPDDGSALHGMDKPRRERVLTEIVRHLAALPTASYQPSFGTARSAPPPPADPAQLRRLLGHGEPLLDCDRGEQWEKLRALCRSPHHELIFIPGAEGQAHHFFLDRVERALPPRPPCRVVRVLWDKKTTPALPQFPHNEREALAALAVALKVSTLDELPSRLSAQLSEHHLVLLHPTVNRCFEDSALQLYYQKWLPALLGDAKTPFRCKIVQPIEWTPAGDWLGAVKLLLSRTATPRAARKQAVGFMDAVEQRHSVNLQVVALPELSQLTNKDVVKFLEVIHYGESDRVPRIARETLAARVLAGDVSSEQVLRRLCDELPRDLWADAAP